MSRKPTLDAYVASLKARPISAQRHRLLKPIATFIANTVRQEHGAQLVFICTHNSRRSHFAHIWAQVLAQRHGLAHVLAFSGGTEVTAFHPFAVAALERAGFSIEQSKEKNPRYAIHWNDAQPPLVCYSKRYDDPANPQARHAAIMTCNEADAACPVIPGCHARFSLPYQDPKRFDQHPDPAQHYDATCREIATEMRHLCQLVQQLS